VALEAGGSTAGVGVDVGRVGGGGGAMRRGRRHTSSIRFFLGKLLEMDGFFREKIGGSHGDDPLFSRGASLETA
jgi:hypothetical protein